MILLFIKYMLGYNYQVVHDHHWSNTTGHQPPRPTQDSLDAQDYIGLEHSEARPPWLAMVPTENHHFQYVSSDF